MGHYGAMVCCVDGMWTGRAEQLAKELFNKQYIDAHTRPGSTRRVKNECMVTAEMVQSIAVVSVGIHEVKDLLVVKHWDCGDHGGSKAFSCPEEEFETYISDLRRVKQFLLKDIITVAQECLSVVPPEPIASNLRHVIEHGLNIKYAILRPRDLNSPNHTDFVPTFYS